MVELQAPKDSAIGATMKGMVGAYRYAVDTRQNTGPPAGLVGMLKVSCRAYRSNSRTLEMRAQHM